MAGTEKDQKPTAAPAPTPESAPVVVKPVDRRESANAPEGGFSQRRLKLDSYTHFGVSPHVVSAALADTDPSERLSLGDAKRAVESYLKSPQQFTEEA